MGLLGPDCRWEERVISPYCFASSGCGELVGNVEKAWRRAGGCWAEVSSPATPKGAGLRQGRGKRSQCVQGKAVLILERTPEQREGRNYGYPLFAALLLAQKTSFPPLSTVQD